MAQEGEAPPPQPSAVVRSLLQEAEKLLAARQSGDALHKIAEAGAAASARQDVAGEAMARTLQARASTQLGKIDTAIQAMQAAAALWGAGGHGPEQIDALIRMAILQERLDNESEYATLTKVIEVAIAERERPVQAADVLREASIRYRDKVDPEPKRTRNLVVAQGLLATAALLRKEYQPDSLALAAEFGNAAEVEKRLGDLQKARAFQQEALAIRERRSADPLVLAGTLEELGDITTEQGDLELARKYYKRELVVLKDRLPDSAELAAALTNLANVKAKQGNLEEARKDYLDVIPLWEKHAPGSPGHAACLNNIGALLTTLGDLEAAGDYLSAALAIRIKDRDSLELASTYENLGAVALAGGDVSHAGEYFEQTLAIRQRKVPGSTLVARTLNNLGVVLFRDDRFDEADKRFNSALLIKQQLQPDSLSLAMTLNNLGEVTLKRGNLKAAETYHRQALGLREKLAPDSLDMANSLTNLAVLAGRRGEWAESERLALRAWDIARAHGAKVGGDQARQAYEVSTLRYFDVLIHAQLALGKAAAAFSTLEEARANALRQALFERDGVGSDSGGQFTASYRAAILARDRAEFDISRASQALAEARAHLDRMALNNAVPDALQRAREQVDARTADLNKAQVAHSMARTQADQQWRHILTQAPRLAPPVLEPAEAAKRIGLDTTYVAFLIDVAEIHVFVLRGGAGGSINVSKLDMAQSKIEEAVKRHRALVMNSTSPIEKTTASGRALFDMLFPRSVRQQVEAADRLVLSPDGALWDVPFASLVVNGEGPPAYLGVKRSLSYTPSLSLLPTDGKGAERWSPWNALVVGHPVFSEGAASAGKRSDVRSFRGRPPAPLPNTGIEARQVADLYGAQPLLQQEATEQAVRERIRGARIVHLATHGYLYPARAMNSGILLAAPKSSSNDNASDGVLEAWEVASQLTLNADLVVLSACETALGETVPGEGVIGLSRAFQMAGARAVAATQWQVSDLSTARLMVSFHQAVRKGQTKDRALQAAAGTLMNGETAHPYFWAAFRLIGDRTSLPVPVP
ncbi:CHAT domain-containing protein [Nitrospira sp. Nam80]